MRNKADTTYTFRLPTKLLDDLKRYADEHDQPVSAVIRKAVERYIKKS